MAYVIFNEPLHTLKQKNLCLSSNLLSQQGFTYLVLP